MTERLELVPVGADDWESDFAEDVRRGLSACPKTLECRYLYDHEGALLFDAICDLPEYYLTRSERSILADNAGHIAACFETPPTLVELGSGSAIKTRLLIEAFLARQPRLLYVPVDIAGTMLEESSRALLESFPGLRILGVAAEYQAGLRYLSELKINGPRLILWLGSNVGNLHRTDAADFLAAIRETMTPQDRFLMGVDLRKDRRILEAAYDDDQGITAKFNLNLLARINRELCGEFCLADFRHRAVYTGVAGRVEIYIDSLRDQVVPIKGLGMEVSFRAGEAIHTENSYKYSLDEIDELGHAAGFVVEHRWLDANGYFSVNLMAPSSARES